MSVFHQNNYIFINPSEYRTCDILLDIFINLSEYKPHGILLDVVIIFGFVLASILYSLNLYLLLNASRLNIRHTHANGVTLGCLQAVHIMFSKYMMSIVQQTLLDEKPLRFEIFLSHNAVIACISENRYRHYIHLYHMQINMDSLEKS